MIRRTSSRMRMCITFLVINLLFIWGNSMLPGNISDALSQWVKDLIARLFAGGPPGPAGHGLLRKLAHFTEFCLLGVWLSWLWGMLKEKPAQTAALSLACGFFAACADETIQIFVPDRGPAFTDVLIDTAGAALGIALLSLGCTIHKKQKTK